MEVILFFLGIALYLLPSILGWNKSNAGAIIALNILLGWTFIGWVVALVWALTSDAPPVVPPTYSPPRPSASSVDEIMKLSTLRDKGALTEEEYQREKQKILNR